MKKILVGLLALTFVHAVDGQKVYEAKCKMCHNQMTTNEEVLKNIDTMVAPPILEVSSHLKAMIDVNNGDDETKRELVLTFMRDYIMNPNIDKSLCRLGAIDRFGVMPSQKENLTQEELIAVTTWLYDNFEGQEFSH